ncbi:hypothetical protein TWF730_003672 [Orbilia blumenaviensis]|uniref:TFIIS N-terminal domain-containing protein n=1 Tax=Orbilia blumenaviensis TaxID=1796055 RepID=A0AAV9U5H4_9PEZI
MPLNPHDHYVYHGVGGEKVVSCKRLKILDQIDSLKDNSLRKSERADYLKKAADRLLKKWTTELREASTKYHQCVIQIKELYRLQVAKETPSDKSLTLVKKAILKRSTPKIAPSAPEANDPRPSKKSRIPVKKGRKTKNKQSNEKPTKQPTIPNFLENEQDRRMPTTPGSRIWGPGSGSRRSTKIGSAARRRPRSAPNERDLLVGLKDEVRRRLNFRAI